jgi:hypothetical protein
VRSSDVLIEEHAEDAVKGCRIVQFFVHGLNGDSYHSWPASDRIFWLQDVLLETFPQAQVLSLGYKTELITFWSRRISQKNTEPPLDVHSKRIFEEIRAIRVETRTVDRCLARISWGRN